MVMMKVNYLEDLAFFVVSFDGVFGLRRQRHICSIIQIIGVNRLRVAIVIVQIEPSFS